MKLIKKYGIYRLMVISIELMRYKIRGKLFKYLYKWNKYGNSINISRKVKLYNTNTYLGNNVHIGENSYLYGNGIIKMNDGVVITENVRIMSKKSIQIGKNTIIAPDTFIIDYDHNYKDKQKTIKEQGYNSQEIIIKENVWIGQGVTILKGTKIEAGCIIGAKSLVKGHLQDVGIYGGIPAKLIKKI